MKRRSFIAVIMSFIFLSSFKIVAAWTHIELGAANYGINANSDKTHKTKKEPSKNQYDLLFYTIDKLIIEKGNKGIFFINDLEKKNVRFTKIILRRYIKNTYPNSQIELKSLTGNYFKLNFPVVDSIHLKNPECWFFNNLKKHKKFLTRCANSSKEGLTFVTYFKKPFLNLIEKLNIGYKVLNTDYEDYIHADGTLISKYGNVVEFLIKSKSTLENEHIVDFTTKSTKYKRKNEQELLNHQFRPN